MSRSLTDRIRTSLPPGVRRQIRLFGERFLTSIGSINGLIGPTNLVALTFDDGPDPAVTPRLLDLLKRRDCRATFFVLTELAHQHPDIVRRLADEGHEVGLHFDRHDRLTDLPVQVARQRLIAARQSLEALAGPVRYFRPPFGGQSFATYFMARSLGLEVVAWGPAAYDWEEQLPSEAAERALRDMRGGEVVLLHDGMVMAPGVAAPTFDRVKMVELLLDGMERAGLAPCTVGAMVASGTVRMSPWFRH
ncbi:MAG: polysaccharide deacetylase family protein [Phenylobacterium sp.]